MDLIFLLQSPPSPPFSPRRRAFRRFRSLSCWEKGCCLKLLDARGSVSGDAFDFSRFLAAPKETDGCARKAE